MAELSSQDVVNHSQSVGDASSTDVTATTLQSESNSGEVEVVVAKENGVHSDDQVLLEESTAKSDTDTSRDARSADARAAKKASSSAKPMTFAKYSVPKVIAANAAKTPIEKQSLSTIIAPQPLAGGRPRLVAKTTSSLSTKVKPFKTAAPDPMQVWNKNRITPQPSTKNLTDEELKQQYGIHLTSRLQSDGEGKESKWADIDDDDEDDWAPETIEWGDGTKTTVNPETAPAVKSTTVSKPSTPATEISKPVLESKPSSTFSTSIGPNAKVLKVGARAETQAQKSVQPQKGSAEKSNTPANASAPAPVPAKSPWAKLPPVEKVSPVEIKQQNPFDAQIMHNGLPNMNITGPPAPEMSADSFNRTWRDSAQPQLFMPNSGRYESVPESRRRMSRNEGFRAPAVLQRPGQNDSSAPEPSPAFQTTRTSSDARRRASSTISGDAAQIIRRMSVKSGETAPLLSGPAVVEPSEQISVTISTPAITPAYQARGDYVGGPGQTDAELEAQRKQQRLLMREQAETARKRRLEDEARLEAEKQERIRQKLISLGPDPKLAKAQQEAKVKADTEAKANEDAERAANQVKEDLKPAPAPTAIAVSPPKPPQPAATGKPQQYGMMKVHALDSVKAKSTPTTHPPRSIPIQRVEPAIVSPDDISPEPPMAETNGLPTDADPIKPANESPVPEPIPRNRPVAEVRSNWARNDHRSQAASSLWGPPHNKALGNGTFDSTLAGYAQDLSSRASSVGGWMNGKTPTVGQSPQLGHITQHVPETRSQTLQNMTSPEPLPLAMNSEADSLQPVKPPAPIGPPQLNQQHQTVQAQQSPAVNGFPAQHANPATASWHNFHNVDRVQQRADFEQFQREQTIKREEEKRTGVRPQANYNFDETYKHVQLGTQPDQRHVSSVAQTNLPPSTFFGAVGSLPPSVVSSNRGSRFFPQNASGSHVIPPRAVTYAYADVPRSPSPPPAEEVESSHPAYAFDSPIPRIRLPPAKAVVKLPPARPPTPPAPTPPPATAVIQPAMPVQPMTWAARAAMPPPKPAPPLRAVSQPIVKNPSWQERFNGLLGNGARKQSDASQSYQGTTAVMAAQPALAVTSASKEPLDVVFAAAASVSLPGNKTVQAVGDGTFTTKEVEDEEDLFEDREAGSLPALYFPSDAPAVKWPRPILSAQAAATPPDSQSQFTYLASPWKEDRNAKPQFAIVRAPFSEHSVKKDLPLKTMLAAATTNNHRPSTTPTTRHANGQSTRRAYRGNKPRVSAIKAQ